MFRKITPKRDSKLEPIADPGEVTGFSSPAQDYSEDRLHIVQKLVKDPTNTYYFEMENNDMAFFGITKGALLIVDKSVKPKHGAIVIANVEGEWITRKLFAGDNMRFLTCGIESQNIPITDEGIVIFGAVTWSCNPMGNGSMIKHLMV
ncbi:S24 family peptidase [Pedobacter westerhofensis]|nr:S24 family peptidase [Pedobacter westerhofensis]